MARSAQRPRRDRVSRALLALSTAVLQIALLGAASAQAGGPVKALLAKPGPRVIAHRGDSKACPENTLPAFESAVKAKADLVELDYVHTADGVPLVIHDETLDRTTDAVARFGGEKIPVASKKLAELRPLDAGGWFGAKFRGARLPTLEESLDAIQPGSTTLIERKAGDAKTCVDLLKRKKLVDSVVVQAFDWEFLKECRKLSPELTLVALGGEELSDEKLDEIESFGAAGVGWSDENVSQATILAAHDRGLKIWVWTVNDPSRASELVEWGADGIITDVPGAIREALVEKE